MGEFETLDFGDFPNDDDADSLYAGAPKIDGNFTKLRQQAVPHTTVLDFSGNRVYAAASVSGLQTYTLGGDFARGGRVVLQLSGSGEIQFPAGVEIQGRYEPSSENLIELVNVGGVSSGAAQIVGRIVNRPATPLTGIVFRQRANNTSNLFTSLSQALSINPQSGDPGNELMFSRMGELEKFRQRDGFFYFRLRYYDSLGVQSGSDVVWRQRSNPADEKVAVESVESYAAISGTSQLTLVPVSGPSQAFGGLCLTTANFFTTWHGHPGNLDANAAFIATMGSTKYVPVSPGNPGVDPADETVELYAEAAP